MMTFHEDEISMNEDSLGYYDALARGGAGIVTVEAPTIDYPLGARWHERYRMDDDRYIPGMTELVDVIHSYGAPAFMQMEHDGPWQNPLFDNAPATFDGPPIGASEVNIPKLGDFHRDMIRGRSRCRRSRTSRASTSTAPSAPRRPATTASTSTPAAATSSTTSSRRSGTGATDEYGGTQARARQAAARHHQRDQGALRRRLPDRRLL